MGGGNNSGSTGLEGIDFSNNTTSEPHQNYDQFGSGMLMPENVNQKSSSNNPFDAFSYEKPEKEEKPNPFVSDVFSKPKDPWAEVMGTNYNAGITPNQNVWSSGYNQPPPQPQNNYNAFNNAGNNPSSSELPKNSGFNHLNPFGGNNNTSGNKTKQEGSKTNSANLPPGVNGFDLFQ